MLTGVRLFSLAIALALPLPGCAGTLMQLPDNPSTGYRWVLNEGASSGLDHAELTFEGNGPPESAQIGAPSPANFRLRCTGPGPVRLVFEHIAPDGVTIGETRSKEVNCD